MAVKELIDRQVDDDEFWHEVEMMRCANIASLRGSLSLLISLSRLLAPLIICHLIL